MMLSQLCRANVLRTTNFKLYRSAPQPAAPISGDDLATNENHEPRCHLIQCSFCNSSRDTLDCPNDFDFVASTFCVTENPAYGLCGKHRVECEGVHSVVGKSSEDDEDQVVCAENISPSEMNHINISSNCPLESIPESKEITLGQAKPHDVKEKFNRFRYTVDRTYMSELSENMDDSRKCDKYIKDSKSCHLWGRSTDDEMLSGTAKPLMNILQRNDVKNSFTLPYCKESDLLQCDPTASSHPKNIKCETHLKKLPNLTKDDYVFVNKQLRSGDTLEQEKLSEISSVNTEESIHEWLMRISDWVDNNSWMKEDIATSGYNSNKGDSDKLSQIPTDSRNQTNGNQIKSDVGKDIFDALPTEASTVNALSKATKESPANIPMVVMQCSRLHSHIKSKPPFQQTSLPMGTLVTALYQESDWLYVQTPHGVEGFVSSSNCAPIGTVHGSREPKRPWEPCDFPIQIRIKNACDFGHLQGAFVPATLPSAGGKRAGPFVSLVKMKTNLYNDRYFNNTFKHRDSIKTAKTVTDILRSSPEIEVNK